MKNYKKPPNPQTPTVAISWFIFNLFINANIESIMIHHSAPYQEDFFGEPEPFESDNLTECLNYYSQTDDREPLENAIDNAETIIEMQIAELQFLIECNQQSNNSYMANKLIAVRKKLQTLLVKNYAK